MERLEKIRIMGFKSINDQTVEIKPINVLIGGNGSGKSNFIGAFTFLREITEARLSNYVKVNGGADRILHFGAKESELLGFRLYFNNSVDQYAISLAPTVEDRLVVDEECTYFWRKDKYSEPYQQPLRSESDEAAISQDTLPKVAGHVKTALNGWRVYHFHDTGSTSPMKKVSDLDDNRFLRSDGSNLASFLYLLKAEYSESYALIRNTIRQIAPFFRDFQLSPRSLNKERIRLEWIHEGTDSYFDCSSFSDGTLRFIALTTLLLQPAKLRPSVVLLDEPELGLHPAAIKILGALIRQASLESQIIVSTQSPLLLDLFDPEDVIVVERENGASVFSRLNASKLEGWLDEYSLGELWEKNELGGRPRGTGL